MLRSVGRTQAQHQKFLASATHSVVFTKIRIKIYYLLSALVLIANVIFTYVI